MNTETGQIYRGPEVIEARMRDEPLVELTERQAEKLQPLSKEARRALWRDGWLRSKAR